MLKFYHVADIHLDSQFSSLPEQKAQIRCEEHFNALSNLIFSAIEENIDYIFIPGDIFDVPDPAFKTVEFVKALFAKFKGKIIISPGNHDFYYFDSPYAGKWSDNVFIFKTTDISSFDFDDLTVYGFASDNFFSNDTPLENFVNNSASPTVMVAHGNISSSESNYISISESQIESSNLTYLALGHSHTNKISKLGETTYAYTGVLEPRGFDEQGQKGYIYGEIDNSYVKVVFRPVSKRIYNVSEIEVTDKTLTEIIDLISQIKADILRVVLTGETDNDNLEDILNQNFLNEFFHFTLRNETKKTIKPWARLNEDSLVGLFLQDLHEKYQKTDLEEQKKQILKAVRFGLDAMQ